MKMSVAAGPEELAQIAIKRLKEAADPAVAAQARTFFKPEEKVHFYGVKTPDLRKLEKDLFEIVKRSWSLKEALTFCEILIRTPHLEARALGFLLLSRYKRSFDAGLLRTIKSWLADNYCDNWAVTDSVSPWIIAPLIARYPRLIEEVKGWTRSRNLWVRRAAAVSMIPLVRKGECMDAAFEIAESLFGDHEDLIHKATGWLMREAGKNDAPRLESFLLAHGPRIPRTTLRYAIERFPEAKRRMILDRTKNNQAAAIA